MLKVTKLREVTRNDLFPSADMVVSMSREFGVPLTAEDFGGECAVVTWPLRVCPFADIFPYCPLFW